MSDVRLTQKAEAEIARRVQDGYVSCPLSCLGDWCDHDYDRIKSALKDATALLAEVRALRVERDAAVRDNETLRQTARRFIDEAKEYREDRDALLRVARTAAPIAGRYIKSTRGFLDVRHDDDEDTVDARIEALMDALADLPPEVRARLTESAADGSASEPE